MLQVLS